MLVAAAACTATMLACATAAPATRHESRPAAFTQEIRGGEVQSHDIVMRRGERARVVLTPPATGMWLRVFAPDSTWLGERFAGDSTPPEPLDFFAEGDGAHRLTVMSMPGAPPGTYRLDVVPLSPEDAARESAALDSAVSWLRENAHALRSVEAGAPHDDLVPLTTMLDGVRVVAIGESTHGTREFHQLGVRLTEFLVGELGFNIFALETSEVAARAINDYVLHGTGDRSSALAGQGFWNWDTRDFADLLDWMREYNRSAPAERRVRFAGFDMQYNPDSRREIVALLRNAAPDRARTADSLLAILTEPVDSARPEFVRYYTLGPEAARPIYTAIRELYEYLAANTERLAARSSQTATDDVLRRMRLLVQFADAHSTPGFDQADSLSGVATRDRYMAENVVHLLSSDPSARVVLYTHAEHARKDPFRMGFYLEKALGEQYYAFGISFHRGGFQALHIGGGNPPRLEAFIFPPAFQRSVGAYMKRAAVGNLFVDFRSAPRIGAVAEWLSRPLPMRSIGNGYAPGNPSGYYRAPVTLGRSFDGILFIEQTTRGVSNPTTRR